MFYKLDMPYEKVGVYPQVIEDMREHSQQAFMKANYELDPVLNNTIPAPPLIIRPGAKVTDALSVVPVSWPFLTVNAKLLHLLQSVRADPLRLMPTTAVKKGVSYPYWLVTIDVRRAEYVCYRDSRFILSDGGHWIGEIHISSAEEYGQLQQQYIYPKRIQATKLVLATAAIRHDIFRLPDFAEPWYIVSQLFREMTEQAKITGLCFEPVE